ncbi:hypothetical protein HAALTHF_39230n [Vreelandella aquamarina]|nr:hypothetical protein HAALTHF_39230n [Halomonas axialensis]
MAWPASARYGPRPFGHARQPKAGKRVKQFTIVREPFKNIGHLMIHIGANVCPWVVGGVSVGCVIVMSHAIRWI